LILKLFSLAPVLRLAAVLIAETVQPGTGPVAGSCVDTETVQPSPGPGSGGCVDTETVQPGTGPAAGSCVEN
jgi:hypothetical protein